MTDLMTKEEVEARQVDVAGRLGAWLTMEQLHDLTATALHYMEECELWKSWSEDFEEGRYELPPKVSADERANLLAELMEPTDEMMNAGSFVRWVNRFGTWKGNHGKHTARECFRAMLRAFAAERGYKIEE